MKKKREREREGGRKGGRETGRDRERERDPLSFPLALMMLKMLLHSSQDWHIVQAKSSRMAVVVSRRKNLANALSCPCSLTHWGLGSGGMVGLASRSSTKLERVAFATPAAAALFRACMLNFFDEAGTYFSLGEMFRALMDFAVALKLSVKATSATSRVFSLILRS